AVGMYPFVVVPRHPFHRGDRHVHDVLPAPAKVDEFLLVEAVERLGDGVVKGIALVADRTGSADLIQAFGVPNTSVLRAAVGMVDQSVTDAAAGPDRHLQRVQRQLEVPPVVRTPAVWSLGGV